MMNCIKDHISLYSKCTIFLFITLTHLSSRSFAKRHQRRRYGILTRNGGTNYRNPSVICHWRKVWIA